MIEYRVDNSNVQNTNKPGSLKRRHVLFIGQDPENSQKYVEVLSSIPRYPVHIQVASSESIKNLQTEGVDLVLLDFSTPQRLQWDLLHAVCEKFTELPIIVLACDESHGIEALRLGAKDYLIEAEVTHRNLARTLRYALEHSSILRDLNKAKRQERSAKARSAHLLDLSTQLKAPINIILGFTEEMHDGHLGSIGSPKYEDYIADTHKCATHLNSLLDNLLQASKPISTQ